MRNEERASRRVVRDGLDHEGAGVGRQIDNSRTQFEKFGTNYSGVLKKPMSVHIGYRGKPYWYPGNDEKWSAPIVRAIQAENPDIVTICSYPLDSVGMVRAVNELGFKPKMIGGAMVGLQATVFKNQLGPLLNGFINYETWVPSKAR